MTPDEALAMAQDLLTKEAAAYEAAVFPPEREHASRFHEAANIIGALRRESPPPIPRVRLRS